MTEPNSTDPGAARRQKLWEAGGRATSPVPHADTTAKVLEYFRTLHEFKDQLVLERTEEALNTLFCPACTIVQKHIYACELFLARIDDPMGVFWQLGRATCLNCGFEEYYPVEKNTTLGMSMYTLQNHLGGVSVAPMPSPYNAGAGGLTQRIQQLKQAYGAPPKKTP